MAKTTHSVRLDEIMERRIQAYASDRDIKTSEALRRLIEKGLATEGVDLYANPVAELISRTMHAEFAFIQRALDEQGRATEEHVAKVCSRGTKAALANVVQVADLSRALIEAYRNDDPSDIYDYYSCIGGRLQHGESLAKIRPAGAIAADDGEGR